MKMLNNYTLAETRLPVGAEVVTLEYGKRYRATYHSGKVMEFVYDGSPRYNPRVIWCSEAWNVTRESYTGYCSEYGGDFCKVEEV